MFQFIHYSTIILSFYLLLFHQTGQPAMPRSLMPKRSPPNKKSLRTEHSPEGRKEEAAAENFRLSSAIRTTQSDLLAFKLCGTATNRLGSHQSHYSRSNVFKSCHIHESDTPESNPQEREIISGNADFNNNEEYHRTGPFWQTFQCPRVQSQTKTPIPHDEIKKIRKSALQRANLSEPSGKDRFSPMMQSPSDLSRASPCSLHVQGVVPTVAAGVQGMTTPGHLDQIVPAAEKYQLHFCIRQVPPFPLASPDIPSTTSSLSSPPTIPASISASVQLSSSSPLHLSEDAKCKSKSEHWEKRNNLCDRFDDRVLGCHVQTNPVAVETHHISMVPSMLGSNLDNYKHTQERDFNRANPSCACGQSSLIQRSSNETTINDPERQQVCSIESISTYHNLPGSFQTETQHRSRSAQITGKVIVKLMLIFSLVQII